MSSFSLYLIGYIIFIAAASVGAYLLGVPSMWIGIAAAALLGIGIISAVSSTRKKDETEASQ